MIEFVLGLGWVTLTLLGLWFIVGVVALELEEGPAWSSAWTIVLIIFACWWFSYDPLVGVTTHWYDLLFYVVAWFAVGAFWSAFRFWRFAVKLAGQAREQLEKMRAKFTGQTFTLAEVHLSGYDHPLPPHPRDNKLRVTSWIMFWPQSVFWFVLNDPIRRLAEFIYEQLGEALAWLGRAAFRDVR